eukprot:gnl/TRDRNA2_/TRDRNA2_58943_c0_seq1.p1 gnl/TRDRNA2_/TRDRNA2_58943_c0~~gnl/TRDRNA2_/TRDRNA2_58943_c0_seq1.p1  ORF type:complete len:291 (-),score=30.55 gnl/TRDRNA2_/TRDRNA2_58943_c0_seq1:72-944(-)
MHLVTLSFRFQSSSRTGRSSSASIGHMAWIRLDNALTSLASGDVTVIDLSGNRMDHEGAEQIAAALKLNSTVTMLNLSHNYLRAQGAEKIASSLEVNSTVMSLNLSDDRIGDHGAQHIAAALEHNSSLTRLDLSDNRIGDQGTEHLAVALERNSSMKSLTLTENEVGSQGAERMLSALQHNTTITILDLTLNKVSHETARRISETLQRNKHGLKVLTLWCEARGPNQYAVTCTSMEGSQVAVLQVTSCETILMLSTSIGRHMKFYGHLRFVRSDGTLLSDPSALIVDCLL